MGESTQARLPEPGRDGRGNGLTRTLVELSGRVTKGMNDIWKGLVGGLWRQVFGRWQSQEREQGEGDARTWAILLEAALTDAFGTSIPADFKIADLDALVESRRDARLLAELLGVLGAKGCPCDRLLISSLWAQVRRFDDLPVLGRFLDALDLIGDEGIWSVLVEIIETETARPGGWPSLVALAADLREIFGPVKFGLFEEIASASDTPQARESLGGAIKALSGRIAADELLVVLARRATTPESAGAAIELTILLLERGATPIAVQAFDYILEGIRDRIAVRRYRKAVDMLESAGLVMDLLDPFLRTEVNADPHLDWLQQALAALPEVSDRVDTQALHDLREVAPDTATLDRYTRSMTAYGSSGLSRDDIRELLRDYVGSDEAMRTFHRVGQVLGELFEGTLTLDYARWALERVDGPLAVKRLKRLLELLFESGIRDQSTQQRLIAIFPLDDESIAWLEGVIHHFEGIESRLYPALIETIRQRCPDVASATRYLRFQRQLAKVSGMDPMMAMDLALEAAQSPNDSPLIAEIRDVIAGVRPVSSLGAFKSRR